MRIIVLCLLLFVLIPTFATHLRSGEILVRHKSSNTVFVIVRVYTSSYNTSVPMGGDESVLLFGDGASMTIPETASAPMGDDFPYVGIAEFQTEHTYSSAGKYTISFSEPNRNEGILNFDNSVATTFYIETTFTLDPTLPFFETPTSLFPPFFTVNKNEPLAISIAAEDNQGSELRYRVVTPLSGKNRPVVNYQLTENFRVDEFNGLVTWDNVFMGLPRSGEYLFAIQIDQYATINGTRRIIGSIHRDVQIVLHDEENTDGRKQSDNLDENNLRILPGDSRSWKVYTSYDALDEADIEVKTTLLQNNIHFDTYDSTTASGPMKVTLVTITSDESLVRDFPYVVAVRSRFGNGASTTWKDASYAVFTTEADPVLHSEAILNTNLLFPNPGANKVRINDQLNAIRRIEMIDSRGQIFLAIQTMAGNEIDLSSVPAGMYVVHGKDKAGRIVAVTRFIKD